MSLANRLAIDDALTERSHIIFHAECATGGEVEQQVEIARVDVSTHTKTREVQISEELAREGVEVTTVPVGRRIDAVPAIRQEGDVTIVPVVEEVVVVERRLMLKEELHVRRVRSTHRHEETVTLRYQEAEVVRRPADSTPGDGTQA
jgi:stress response protein YsnF